METNSKTVGVILLNWHNGDDTIECLKSLSHCLSSDSLRIVVINNSPGDPDSSKFRAFANVTTIDNSIGQGFCRGNNQGIEWAIDHRVDFIFILSNDTEVAPDCIEALRNTCQQDSKQLISPLLLRYNSEDVDSYGGSLRWPLGITSLNRGEVPAHPDYLSGAAIFGRREAFECIGGFDEDFFLYYEDTELSQRALKHRYRLAIHPSATVWHKSYYNAKGPSCWSAVKFYMLARNNFIFARKAFSPVPRFFWHLGYLGIGQWAHLFLFCRSCTSWKAHWLGIWHGISGRKGPPGDDLMERLRLP